MPQRREMKSRPLSSRISCQISRLVRSTYEQIRLLRLDSGHWQAVLVNWIALFELLNPTRPTLYGGFLLKWQHWRKEGSQHRCHAYIWKKLWNKARGFGPLTDGTTSLLTPFSQDGKSIQLLALDKRVQTRVGCDRTNGVIWARWACGMWPLMLWCPAPKWFWVPNFLLIFSSLFQSQMHFSLDFSLGSWLVWQAEFG